MDAGGSARDGSRAGEPRSEGAAWRAREGLDFRRKREKEGARESSNADRELHLLQSRTLSDKQF